MASLVAHGQGARNDPKPAPTSLDSLLASAEGYVHFLMRKSGRVPPALSAVTLKGMLRNAPHGLAHARAKAKSGGTACPVCAAQGATTAEMVLGARVALARPG